jgi:hypothetical protein
MRMGSLAEPHGPAGSFVVSVSVTPPAASSAAVGVYVAVSVEAFGLYVPAPPLQVPVAAPPPTMPASCTAGADVHTVTSLPAFAVAMGLMLMRTSSLATAHGPPVAFVVSVSVTPPAAISAGVGSYVAFSAEAFGLNVPAPPLHVPLEAPPPTTPASCARALLAHTEMSAPAFAVAALSMVTFIWSLAGAQAPPATDVVSVSVTEPAAISVAVGV